ncbi:hypothetical protein [Candidatus Alkanophaga liquidiphilum]
MDSPEIHAEEKRSEEYAAGLRAKKYVEQRLAENGNECLVKTEKRAGSGSAGRHRLPQRFRKVAKQGASGGRTCPPPSERGVVANFGAHGTNWV